MQVACQLPCLLVISFPSHSRLPGVSCMRITIQRAPKDTPCHHGHDRHHSASFAALGFRQSRSALVDVEAPAPFLAEALAPATGMPISPAGKSCRMRGLVGFSCPAICLEMQVTACAVTQVPFCRHARCVVTQPIKTRTEKLFPPMMRQPQPGEQRLRLAALLCSALIHCGFRRSLGWMQYHHQADEITFSARRLLFTSTVQMGSIRVQPKVAAQGQQP